MTNPKVSIIVPVYNADNCLRRCIDSILAQTFTDFELLLIDDGSKDLSGIICDEYAENNSNIRVYHKPNGGASSARNIGLKNARGEWITFCDADDYVFPNWLQNFVKHFSPQVDFISQGLEGDKPLDGRMRLGINKVANLEEIELELRKARIFGYLVVKCFRKSIIDKYNIQFKESLKFREDCLFVLDYLCNNLERKGICIDTVGYYYFVPSWGAKYRDESNDFKIFYEEAIKYLHKDNFVGTNFCLIICTRILLSSLSSLKQCRLKELLAFNNLIKVIKSKGFSFDDMYAKKLEHLVPNKPVCYLVYPFLHLAVYFKLRISSKIKTLKKKMA